MKKYRYIQGAESIKERILSNVQADEELFDDDDWFEDDSHEEEIQKAVNKMPRLYICESLIELAYSLYAHFYEELLGQEPDNTPYLLYKRDSDYNKKVVWDIAFPVYDDYIIFAMDFSGEAISIMWWDTKPEELMNIDIMWGNIDDLYDEDEEY